MKKQTMIALVAVFALLGGISLRSQSVERGQKHQVVVLWAYQHGHNVYTETGYHYQWDGARVYNSSSSQGAPTFPQQYNDNYDGGTEVAEALAQLLDQGFHVVEGNRESQYFMLAR